MGLPVVEHEPLILVVDAHELIASSLALALKHAGFTRVNTASPDTIASDTAQLGLAPGDIVLVGLLHGDGRTALPLIRPLAEQGCRVLVMASDQALPLTGDCLHNGAETVIDKAMSFERLLKVLHRLISGARAMTDDERASLIESAERHGTAERALRKPFESLTDREAEVLAALVAGSSPKRIAHHNSIAISTVRGHIQKALSKLDASSQREALAMARHAGWP